MAFTLQDFFSGLAGKDLEATQLKRAQLEAAQTALADAKAAKEGEQATASKIASMFAPQGNAEEQGGLIGLGGTPDMLPSIGQTFGQMPAGQSATQGGGGQPQKSAFQTLQEQVAQNNAIIQNLSKSSNIYDQRAAEKYKAENAKILEKMPEMQSKELDTRLKSEMANYNRLSGIVDDQSLNLAMAQASPEERAALAKNYGIMPNFGTGMYSFNTPEVQTLIKGAKQQSLTQVQRYEQEKRLADIRNDEQQRILQEREIVEKERANRETEARRREELGLKRQEFSFRQSKAGGLEGLPKPAPGYRWNDDGSAQELIPGGPAFTKMKTTAMKESKLLDSAKNEYGNILNVIDQLIGSEDGKIKPHAGLGTGTGMTGVGVRRIPGTDARDLQAKLSTLEAKTAFGSLQKMRAESPTGGALGQVAVKELELLKNSIAPIDPTVSKEDFVKNLKDLRDKVKGSEKRLFDTYQEAYAPVLGGNSKGAAPVESDMDRWNNTPSGQPFKTPDGRTVIKP